MSSNQLIVFNLGLEEYAVNISYAHEIMRIPRITPIPGVPGFVQGVINLREKIIPIFDLKQRFNMDKGKLGADSRLLILDLDGIKAGIIVDDVSEVIRVDSSSIEHLPNEISSISGNSIEGVIINNQRIIIALNILKLKTEIFKYNLEKEISK
ncbi:purine-binding chemotaxis protein CheW [Clostridium sp. 19966]|uniref:chemotaxis protein CheW n=1 Tax=Clostridium sp. 19966 TaxID=2768166 RepID=UPI0028E07DF4|nr:chemotaxis protein CheW [Clostridium sp. 19966]MDT8716487.1 purine-binding chemotaxis protein CheW [Clostridium sp. 19966]